MNRLTLYVRRVASVINQLKIRGLITAFTSGAEFSQLIKPLGSRPLVLSAHPGNDVMALGGTLAWYAKLNVPVTILTFTAGRHGTNTGRKSKSLGPKRRKEAVAAYKAIGGEIKPVFGDLDENFEVDDDLTQLLLEFIDDINPDIIYAPSFLDNHPDNQAISQVLVRVLRHLPSPRLRELWIAQYELWSPTVPNKVLNIDDYLE